MGVTKQIVPSYGLELTLDSRLGTGFCHLAFPNLFFPLVASVGSSPSKGKEFWFLVFLVRGWIVISRNGKIQL